MLILSVLASLQNNHGADQTMANNKDKGRPSRQDDGKKKK